MTPRSNPDLFGHGTAERTLRDAVDRGRLHHAWLLCGPDGIGKATLAFRFARALLAGFPASGLAVPPDHPVFRRVASGAHPDLHTIARTTDEKKKQLRAEIPAEDVRALGGFLSLTAATGGWRVVVVDGADHLNRFAANALLKLLEEPPPRTALLLTAAAPGRLPPTVRSRCRRLAMAPLAPAEFAAVLRATSHEALADRDTLFAASGGAPGRAIGWAEAGLLPLVEEAGLLGADAGSGADRARRAAIVEAAAGREGGLACLVAALRVGTHRRARDAALAGAASAGDDGGWSALGALEAEAARFYLDKRHAAAAALELGLAR